MSSPTGELPKSRLGRTQSLAPCQGHGPSNSPLKAPRPKPNPGGGTQSRPSGAGTLCTYLEGRGDPGVLGHRPAPCPRRQKPAVSLHLWEEQAACDLAGWSRQSWAAGPEVPKSGWAPQTLLGLKAALANRCDGSHCSEEHRKAGQRAAKAQWASCRDKLLPAHFRPLDSGQPHLPPQCPRLALSSKLYPTCLTSSLIQGLLQEALPAHTSKPPPSGPWARWGLSPLG